MADTAPASSAASLPPPQTAANAPGQQQFGGDGTNATSQNNGQGNPSHMPPPSLPPVIIPQNTNPIPTAITSPMGAGSGVMSPNSGGSAGGFVRRSAPEPNKRALYVGGLDPRVTDDVLRQIFETAGHVQSVKIIPDKNVRLPLTMRHFTSIPFLSLRFLSFPFLAFPCLSFPSLLASAPRLLQRP